MAPPYPLMVVKSRRGPGANLCPPVNKKGLAGPALGPRFLQVERLPQQRARSGQKTSRSKARRREMRDLRADLVIGLPQAWKRGLLWRGDRQRQILLRDPP